MNNKKYKIIIGIILILFYFFMLSIVVFQYRIINMQEERIMVQDKIIDWTLLGKIKPIKR